MKEIISQKIKNARALKGLSQQELADMIGVSKQMISKYEKGESIPTSSNFLKLSKSLKVKIDYFFKPFGQAVNKRYWSKRTGLVRWLVFFWNHNCF